MVIRKSTPARLLEAGLFASRWLLAPFYAGLAVDLAALLGVFVLQLPREILHIADTPPDKRTEAGILMALSLIDLSLSANLLIIVILSGYENFLSRISAAPDDERPAWMGTVDFSGLKMKLIVSIAAVSAIALLRIYLETGDHPTDPTMLLLSPPDPNLGGVTPPTSPTALPAETRSVPRPPGSPDCRSAG